MKEIDFRMWLKENNCSPKVISDTISRLKKFEHELNIISIDEEYRLDKCSEVLSFFQNKGQNRYADQFVNCNLPIGKYHLSTYKLALQKYILFLNSNED